MGRLIDSSSINNYVMMHKSDWGIFATDIGNAIDSIVMECPTVNAIPIAEAKKFLEEGTKNISNNVLAIIREDYIHKADYENRLKADMIAMLTELQLEIEEIEPMYMDMISPSQVDEVIEHKIDKLKGA